MHGDRMALRQPSGKNVETWTWNQYVEIAEEIAAGLRTLGLVNGDHILICSETSANFFFADQGILMNGSVSGALYPSYPPAELKRLIANADAKALFVEDPKMYSKLQDAPVQHIILMSGEVPGVRTMAGLRHNGRYSAEVHPDDDAILYLTSGATGDPKMVMVSHASIVDNIKMTPEIVTLTPDDITVAFLPSAHIAQRLICELLPMFTATPVSFAESLSRLPNELKTVRPTFFLAPPRVWERIYTSIRTEIQKKPKFAQNLFAAALALGLGAARYKRAGKPVPWRIRVPLRWADKAIFSKIRERFGGRLRLPVSGSAPLGADLMEFYDAIGMPLIEGFGLTEGGVVAINPLDAPRPGSIGKALSAVKFKVADDGELLIQSATFSKGYYKDPAATAELFRDGWLHTGDIGTIDEDGFIYITGRKKELIVASNGKKIYPARIEAMFKFEPLINQVLLAGDRLPHLVALFTIHPAAAETVPGAKEAGVPLHEAPPVHAEVHAIVSRINKQLAPFEQVKRFRILHRELSIEQGEVTATMKVRRQQVMKNFQEELDSLYHLSASGRGGE
jgi:long-chain acyl-CoA synthetase